MMGAFALIFCGWTRCVHFLLEEFFMNKRVRNLVFGALIGAMYVALTHFQNILLPGSTTWAIQFRASEALCVLALFTPAAIPGLAVGCFVFNLHYVGALPLDLVVGTLASFLACWAMWKLRKCPWVALAMPAVFNAILVGWELTVYVGSSFWLNALYVAVGEAAVLYTLGLALYAAMKKNGLARKLFG
jgi:uncharacterized membrane protein